MRRTLLAVALLLLPTLVLAQAETTGRVTGTVLDEDRQPVVGAEILFESPALQGQRKSISDSNGRYLSSLLPPGIYTMTVNAPGKTPVQYTFRVSVGQTVPIDVTLKSGEGLVEDVTVFAPASKLETTAGGETFNVENEINRLPVDRTADYLSNITTLAPNVSEVTFTNNATARNLAISGAPSFDNAVLLDGADISDPFYSAGTTVYLEEAIEEVQVITNGASARYGRFQGGVVNATTKSGGNTFDGTFRVDLSKQSWNSQTPFNELQSDELNKVYSATVGGPILKDHLWFFVGGRTIPETAESHSLLQVPGGAFTTTTNEDRFQVKLTGAINANHTLEAGYLDYEREITNYDPFFWVAEPNAVIPKRTDPREFIAAEYRGVLSDRMYISAQYAEKNVSIGSGGNRLDVSPILELYNGEYRAYANGWWDPNDPSVRDNESLAASMTHALSGGTWGDHTLEYGIQFVNSITAGDNRQSPTGYNLYFVEPTGTDASFADCDATGNCTFDFDSDLWFYERLKAIPGAGEQELHNLAIYAQDAWEIGKWRLDLGLRWESWEGDAISPAMTLDFDELAPRLGLTYNITADWQLQASWGKFVARFNDNVANGVTGISSIYGPGILQEYAGPDLADQTEFDVQAILEDDANWGTILGFVDPRQPTTFFADNLSASYANDLNLSVKRALPRNSGIITATYSKREFKDLLDDFKGDNGTIDVIPPGGSPEPVDVVIWKNCGTCRRDYEAVAIGAEYRPSATWDLGGNYTYAKTRGNYEGESTGQPSIGSIIGNYERTFNAAFAYPYGYMNSDVRHRARAWGNYRFDFGRGGQLTLGGILFYRSGANYSKVARIDAEDDPAPDYSGAPGSYNAFFDGRGNNRFDGFWTLDTTIRYDISFWRDLSAYAKFDVLNITDEDSLISHRTGGSADADARTPQWVPNADFGTASSERNYQAPRTFVVSLGFNF